ncbi:MAG: hypothetical protein APR62_01330 [Smithella sp. SDB]|nr:MAG: hypothetical protein APR62_01330 [Smithella sp. SDB]
MINQINANVLGLKVEWIGMTKPQLIKEGPKAGTYTEVKPSIQLSRKNEDGQTITFYANSKEPFPQTLKVNDIVDMEMRIRAYKDGLYCDVIKINQNGNGKGIKI